MKSIYIYMYINVRLCRLRGAAVVVVAVVVVAVVADAVVVAASVACR